MNAARKVNARMEVLLNELCADAFEKGKKRGIELAFSSARGSAVLYVSHFKDKTALDEFIELLRAAELTYGK
jgi:hypothetical protein